MMARICAGLRPCCDASATMPAISRMPVIAIRHSTKTFTSSQKIIRFRMQPNTPASLPVAPKRTVLSSFLPGAGPDAGPDALERVGHDRHQLLLEAHLADLATHLDPQKLVADLAREVVDARRQQLRDAAPVRVQVEVQVAAIDLQRALAANTDGVAEQVELIDADAVAFDGERRLGLLEGGAVGQTQAQPLEQVEQQRQAVHLAVGHLDVAGTGQPG